MRSKNVNDRVELLDLNYYCRGREEEETLVYVQEKAVSFISFYNFIDNYFLVRSKPCSLYIYYFRVKYNYCTVYFS